MPRWPACSPNLNPIEHLMISNQKRNGIFDMKLLRMLQTFQIYLKKKGMSRIVPVSRGRLKACPMAKGGEHTTVAIGTASKRLQIPNSRL